MKNVIYLFLFSFLFSCTKKESHTFTVEGKVRNSNAKMIYLEEDIAGSLQPVVVDSAILNKDGAFKLGGAFKEQSMFSLRTDNEKYPAALLINDTRKVEVTVDATDKNVPYEIKGSPASQAIIEFDKNIDKEAQIISQLRQEADSLMKSKANDTIIRFKYTEYNTALQNIKNYTLDQLDKSNSPVLSLYIIGGYQRMAGNLGLKGFTETELTDLINKAAVKFPNHTALNNIKDKLKPRKAPDFTLPDTSGHAVSLSSFKGKFVLVDFWASWCQPCRGENPNVVKAYNQFKDKNFTILGVSLDKEKDSWKKAISDDGLAWTQVSDLKFWNSEPAALYNVTGIPYNFLIDPKGNIIAEDIRGEDLFNTLNQVLK